MGLCGAGELKVLEGREEAGSRDGRRSGGGKVEGGKGPGRGRVEGRRGPGCMEQASCGGTEIADNVRCGHYSMNVKSL